MKCLLIIAFMLSTAAFAATDSDHPLQKNDSSSTALGCGAEDCRLLIKVSDGAIQVTLDKEPQALPDWRATTPEDLNVSEPLEVFVRGVGVRAVKIHPDTIKVIRDLVQKVGAQNAWVTIRSPE